MKNFLRCLGLVSVLTLGLSGAASADDPPTIYARAKAGVSIYSNLDPLGSAFGLGFDLGFRGPSGLGLYATTLISFSASATDPATLASVDAHSIFAGAGPSYTVTQGPAAISFGVSAGGLSATEQLSTTSQTFPSTSKTKFAIAPMVQADFQFTPEAWFTIGVTYVASFGSSPNPGIFYPNAGLNWAF